MTGPVTIYAVDSSAAAREILDRLAGRFRTRPDGGDVSKRTYCDTFDWRLFRRSGVLSLLAAPAGSRLLCWDDLDGRSRRRMTVSRRPEFAPDLSAGPFRDELLRVAGIRRLLPLVRVECRGERIALIDRREKTVARVHLERCSAGAGVESPGRRRMPPRLRVEGLTGYDRARASLIRFLEREVGLEPHEGGELTLALDAVGQSPGSYTGKLDLDLDPALRADRAVKRVLTVLFEIMQANEDGMRRDLDPEFLHDFRVAVRRTRSCLGQVKGVLDEERVRRFAKEFAWIGQVTGPTRDLDVYLLNLDDYRDELPETSRGDLDPLAAHLRKRQRAALRRQTDDLGSPRYAKLKRAWGKFLEDDADEQAPNASRPIRNVAAKRIGRAYARVRKQGSGLDAETPAEAIHRLRIACKKLRYLLEFFRGLFDERRVRSIVRSLKRLQDDLGDYNDLEIQQKDLHGMAGEIVEQDGADSATLLAMGRLIDRLETRQRTVRGRLVKRVKSFVNDRTSTEIAELFE